MNHTLTKLKGSVRGLHFQLPPHSETKIVQCLRGTVFDVVVDMRAGSPTFLKWFSHVLSSEAHDSLYIPEGFAHGFQTLEADCEMLYLHSETYVPHAEGGVQVTEPLVSIEWPLPIVGLSQRDKEFPLLETTFTGINL